MLKNAFFVSLTCFLLSMFIPVYDLIEMLPRGKQISNFSISEVLATDFKYSILRYVVTTLGLIFSISIVSTSSWRILTSYKSITFLDGSIYFYLWCVLHWVALFVVNSVFYPASTMAMSGIGLIYFAVFSLFLMAGYSVTLWCLVRRSPKVFSALLVLGLILFVNGSDEWLEGKPQKNIIIIGVDSLQGSLINDINWVEMPYLASLISGGENFTNAYTPLGRTMPAWVSIVTGQYPRTNGIRFNLQNPNDMPETSRGFMDYIRSQGYKSVYAMDERRFSSMGAEFGFDETLGPAHGLQDYLLAEVGDHPLFNTLSLIPATEGLYPELSANRAVAGGYRTESFDRLLKNYIMNNRTENNFIAVHYTLAHKPFYWADWDFQLNQSTGEGKEFQKYIYALKEVDFQISNLFGSLEKAGLLDDALVILLSDHGEGFPGEESSADSLAYGHGTHSGDKSQSKVLLNVSVYKDGKQIASAETKNNMVSLVDVAPTIVDHLGGDKQAFSFDGISLYEPDRKNTRLVFSETGFVLAGLLNVANPDNSDLLVAGGNNYRPVENGTVIMDDASVDALIAGKSRTVYSSQAIVSVSAAGKISSNTDDSVIMNVMLKGLCNHYGEELVAVCISTEILSANN
jgi:hypothetical protein